MGSRGAPETDARSQGGGPLRRAAGPEGFDRLRCRTRRCRTRHRFEREWQPQSERPAKTETEVIFCQWSVVSGQLSVVRSGRVDRGPYVWNYMGIDGPVGTTDNRRLTTDKSSDQEGVR